MENFFITSDTHFSHKNLIYYSNRPYEPTEEGLKQMNEDLLKPFDELPRGSTILNLGDICMNDNVSFQELKSYIDRMKENDKHLWIVFGNHDRDTMPYHTGHNYDNPIDFFTALGFEKVFEYPFIYEEKYIFSHEPVYLRPGTNFYNVHGHTHQFPVDADYFNRDCENWAMMEVVKKYMLTKQKNLDIDTSVKPSYRKTVDPLDYIDVCWDYNHKILSFEEIIKKC